MKNLIAHHLRKCQFYLQYALERGIIEILSKKREKNGILGHSKFEALRNSYRDFHPFSGNQNLDRFEKQIWNFDLFEVQ